MDKSCHSSADSTSSSSSSSNRDHFLKHLNKISHRISKPVIRRPPLDQNHLLLHHRPPPAPPQPPPPPLQQPTPPPPPPHNHFHPPQPQPQNGLQPPPHQPPVYNINKNDFRDVVQKLTGSPAHERFSTPPPIHPPKPQSSRLQRIRPPPLAAVGNRPPPLLNAGPPQPPPSSAAASGLNPSNHPNVATAAASPAVGTFASNFRQPTPLSPLPPFPSVHGAAESPISAYLRCFQGSIAATNSDPKQQLLRYSPVISPRWSNPAPPPPPPSQQQHIPPPSSSTALPQFPAQSSPLPFGCLPSPRSQYPLLSPSLLFSPTAGQLGFPVSPTLPVPSPRWRDL